MWIASHTQARQPPSQRLCTRRRSISTQVGPSQTNLMTAQLDNYPHRSSSDPQSITSSKSQTSSTMSYHRLYKWTISRMVTAPCSKAAKWFGLMSIWPCVVHQMPIVWSKTRESCKGSRPPRRQKWANSIWSHWISNSFKRKWAWVWVAPATTFKPFRQLLLRLSQQKLRFLIAANRIDQRAIFT